LMLTFCSRGIYAVGGAGWWGGLAGFPVAVVTSSLQGLVGVIGMAG
jgi:hypothetical protein